MGRAKQRTFYSSTRPAQSSAYWAGPHLPHLIFLSVADHRSEKKKKNCRRPQAAARSRRRRSPAKVGHHLRPGSHLRSHVAKSAVTIRSVISFSSRISLHSPAAASICVSICCRFLRFGMATVRSLKIKTSTCRRVVKELRSYEEEVGKEAAKTAAMKNRGADPYDLKQQVRKSSTGKTCSLDDAQQGEKSQGVYVFILLGSCVL